MNWPAMAWRGVRRDLRAGEIWILSLALMISVASVSAVAFFMDRVQQQLRLQGSTLLAADVVVESTQPIPALWRERADDMALGQARSASFRSMLIYGAAMQLAEVKAVDDNYPLRGQFTLATADKTISLDAGVVARGSVLIDAQMQLLLAVQVGDYVQLGEGQFRIGGIIQEEPDRGGQVFAIAPRVMMHWQDLAQTELLQLGSVVDYRLLLAGNTQDIDAYYRWVQTQLQEGDRINRAQDARPAMQRALQRGTQLLNLAALMSVLMGGIAVYAAAQRFARRHWDASAILRCFGATRRQVLYYFALQLFYVGMLGSLLGVLLGYVAQLGLASSLQSFFGAALPAPRLLQPAAHGLLIGVVSLLGFALPSLLRLRAVPPLQVLRRQFAIIRQRNFMSDAVTLVLLMALIGWYVQDVRLTLIIIASIVMVLVILVSATRLFLWGLARLRKRLSGFTQFGIAAIVRREQASMIQVVTIGLAIMILLVLRWVDTDLFTQWRAQLPNDVPNRFLVGAQFEQQPGIADFFTRNQMAAPAFYPMTRARLLTVNDKAVAEMQFTNPRSQRLATRTFNLSWAKQLKEDNEILAGHWWDATGVGVPQFSVAENIMQSLSLRLGDQLQFDVAGLTVQGPITSVRSVDWTSLAPNFFVLLPPGVLTPSQASYIAAVYIAPEHVSKLGALVQQFPNVSLIDVDAMLNKVRSVVGQAIAAVQFIFGFTIATALLVLFTAIQSNQDERIYEGAILRSLGATRYSVLGAITIEFVVLGVLAGGLGALSASLVCYGLAEWVFAFQYQFSWDALGIALALGLVSVGLLGLGLNYKVVRQAPLRVLYSG